MRIFLFRFNLLAIFLLFAFGCSTPTHVNPTSTWIDPAEIDANIDKSLQQSTVLDVSEEAGTPKDEGPRVKDLSETLDSRNQSLAKVSSPKPKTFPTSPAAEGILLNFDNADIYEVIQVMAETLDLNYIIDPQVKGVVNIRSGEKIPLEHLYDIFKKILNMNGLDIRQEGVYDYIFVAKKLSAPIIYGPDEISRLKNSPRMVTQIAPIMHLSSTEAAKLIEPYLSDRGSIFDLADQNIIIITDFEAKIVDALVLLSRLDISPLSTLKIRLIKVENAPLFNLFDELNEILTALKINKKDHEGVTITSLERVNSLLLMSSNETMLNTAEKWVRELDVVPSQGRDNIYIYNVRNSVASDLEGLVSSLISEKGATSKPAASPSVQAATSATDAAGKKVQATTKKSTKTASGGASSPTLQFTGEPVLLSDDSRNIILIRAMPADYARILKLLERLDNLPRQVLIEVVVAEVSLTDSWQLGIEWTLKSNIRNNKSDYTGLFAADWDKFPSATGLTLSLLNSADDVRALLNTVASDNQINVLSSPHLLVLNNETASINVGQEVPIITSQTISPDTTISDVQNIQYRDTGIILTVTPRINYDGIIILEVEQQVSSVEQTATTVGINSPTINNRTLKTKLAVKDGQPILMGGLISTQKDNIENGIPGFKDIPGLGWLFKYESEATTKRELLLMITPYVIESENVLDQYIREFNKKMGTLREELSSVAKKKYGLKE